MIPVFDPAIGEEEISAEGSNLEENEVMIQVFDFEEGAYSLVVCPHKVNMFDSGSYDQGEVHDCRKN